MSAGSSMREPGAAILRFEGLATLCHVFLNGQEILASESMFTAHEMPVTLAGGDDLAICFRALGPRLAGDWRARPLASPDDHAARAARMFARRCSAICPAGARKFMLSVRGGRLRSSAATVSIDNVSISGRARKRAASAASAFRCTGCGKAGDAASLRRDEQTLREGRRQSLFSDHQAAGGPALVAAYARHAASLQLIARCRMASDPLGKVGFRRIELDRVPMAAASAFGQWRARLLPRCGLDHGRHRAPAG